MRRLVLLAVVLILVLAACGGGTGGVTTSAPGDTGTTGGHDTSTTVSGATTTTGGSAVESLTFWHYWDGLNGEVISELAGRYSEETGITVEPAFFGYGDLLTKLQTSAGGGERPDVAVADLV